MKTYSKKSFFVSAAALFALTAGSTMAGESTLQFSDPTQPGHLVLKLAFGNVEIVGTETSEVTVHSEVASGEAETPREDGLRRLDSDNGFQVNEAYNVITLSFGWFGVGGWKAGKTTASDAAITVPENTAVTIERGGTGNVAVRNVTGDVEISGAIGDVDLENVSGGLLLEATNSNIDASFVELPESKPVSITVVNGDVDISVPADARANVRFRTLHGEMLTDFSEEELESRFEKTGAVFKGDAKLTGTVVNALETAKAAAEQQRKSAEVMRRMAEKQHAPMQAGESAAQSDESTNETVGTSGVVPSVGSIHVPMPMMPKMPHLPPMAGGKLVVGTLNGGGTDLLITTLTGTITLRKNDGGEVGK